METRYVVEKHTNDSVWGFRVHDTRTGKRHGFGLILEHAAGLAEQLEREHRFKEVHLGA
jgi:hypothetical protein